MCHVRPEEVFIHYDGYTLVVDDLPGRNAPFTIAIEADSTDWRYHESYLRDQLFREGYFLMPEAFVPYLRLVEMPNGLFVEVDLRVYPDVTLHTLTEDRAIHFNVAARTDFLPDTRRMHIAEAKTQLGEHQHELAYRLIDRICGKLQAGEMELETPVFLAFESMTPDEVDEWTTQQATS